MGSEAIAPSCKTAEGDSRQEVIVDPIGTFARFVAELLPADEVVKPVRIVVQFLVYISTLGGIAFARPIAMRVPWIRRRLAGGEAYVGDYVQIINSGEERRYSLVRVYYNSASTGYFLRGNQYDPEGNRAIDFTSRNVAFREGDIDYLEFVWAAETVSDKSRFDGYTQMRIDDRSDPEMYEGRGFFVTFDDVPRRFDLRFFKITEQRLNEFRKTDSKIDLPKLKTEKSRHDFVVALHAALVNHPSLQPTEESGKPIL